MLYQEQPYNYAFQASLTNTKSVVSLEGLFDVMRHTFGKLALMLVLVLLGLPLVFLFGLVLQFRRRKFRRAMKNGHVFKGVDDYVKVKNLLADVISSKKSLNKVSKLNLKKVPFLLRYTFGQMKKMSATLLTYFDWLESQLKCMNEEQFKSNSQTFTFVSEKDMWVNRNKAYQYWM